MENIPRKDELIYEYLKESYSNQKELLSQLDARVGNYLIIIGIILTASSCFASEVIKLYGNIKPIWFYIILSIYILANISLILSLWYSIKIFYISKFSVPSVKDESLKELLRRVPAKVDAKILISDFSLNYLDAFRENMIVSEERKKASKSIKLAIYISFALLIIFLSSISVVKILQTRNDVMEKIGTKKSKLGGVAMRDEDNSKPKKDPKASEESDTGQPSARGNPEVIELGNTGNDSVKKILIDKEEDKE